MSDARDAVGKALGLNKQLAARKLMQKQDLEAELAQLEKDRAEVALLGDATLLAEIERRMESVATDLAAADLDLKNAVKEMDELRKLDANHETNVARATANAILNPDPFIQTPAQATLEHTREHIKTLDAQARLGAELSGAPAAAVSLKPASKEEADARARAAFEAMRARKSGAAAPDTSAAPSSPDSSGPAGAPSDPPMRPTPSKKEL